MWSFREKPGRRFRQKVTEKNENKNLTPFKAVDESDANHVLKKKTKKTTNWARKSTLRVPHRTIFTL